MKYTAVLAFNPALDSVLLVYKKHGPIQCRDHWNGIGGKINIGESPVSAAAREFHEETGIPITKDELIAVEHQRWVTGVNADNEVYWYGLTVQTLWRRLPHSKVNDVGEELKLFLVRDALELASIPLAMNLCYLIPKTQRYIELPYTERPW